MSKKNSSKVETLFLLRRMLAEVLMRGGKPRRFVMHSNDYAELPYQELWGYPVEISNELKPGEIILTE